MKRRIQASISQFREAAVAKGDFAHDACEDHRLHRIMAAAWQQLSVCGADGVAGIKSLLADDSKHVRLWAATQLLATGDESAVHIVESEANAGDVFGLNAQMVLEQWREGKLVPPFTAT